MFSLILLCFINHIKEFVILFWKVPVQVKLLLSRMLVCWKVAGLTSCCCQDALKQDEVRSCSSVMDSRRMNWSADKLNVSLTHAHTHTDELTNRDRRVNKQIRTDGTKLSALHRSLCWVSALERRKLRSGNNMWIFNKLWVLFRAVKQFLKIVINRRISILNLD